MQAFRVVLVICCLSLSHLHLATSQEEGEKKEQNESGGGGLFGLLGRKPQGSEAENSLAAEMKRAEQICNSNQKVPIGSVSEMLRLIAIIGTNDQVCKQRYLSAIYELDPILKLPKDSFCDERAFELIKDYHFRFIQPFKRANRRPTQFEPMPRDLVKEQLHPEPRKYTVEFDEHSQVLLAPIAVRHFFLKFALQVSLECKKNLLNNLLADAERVLSEQDREVLHMFDKDSPISQALAGGIEQMDFDSVLHIPELDGKLKKASTGEEIQAEGREQHLKTSANENSALYQMLFACKNRFKPLYDKLIMPIVKLSKLGYDYQGAEGFTDREQQFLKGGRMKTWLVVVHVCEIFKNTYLLRPAVSVETPEAVAQSENEEASTVAPEEEGKLKVVSEEEETKLEVVKAEDSSFKPVDYELTVRNSFEDKLMIQSERQLDLELSRKHGHSDPFGFRGFLRRASSYLKSQLAKLDLERFAHYRRNSLFYSGLLNFLSACSNVASISLTISGIVASG